jgi:hypothetical protein
MALIFILLSFYSYYGSAENAVSSKLQCRVSGDVVIAVQVFLQRKLWLTWRIWPDLIRLQKICSQIWPDAEAVTLWIRVLFYTETIKSPNCLADSCHFSLHLCLTNIPSQAINFALWTILCQLLHLCLVMKQEVVSVREQTLQTGSLYAYTGRGKTVVVAKHRSGRCKKSLK